MDSERYNKYIGLDMYLTKETNIWGKKEKKKIKISGIKEVKVERIEKITEEIGYWRKVNCIHKWFVDNIQNGEDECKKHEVTKEELTELLKLVEKVLKNHKLAKKLLPNEEGFFFGGTEYDECYFKDLEETKKILKEAIKEKHGYIYYQSSW